mmetsp:Transcript_9313/g.38222  ORF Transcript_9313/g.38222 Transcript_9313/m.38222 type:complete len:224 (-) Transcript_9313:1117-1788(-)
MTTDSMREISRPALWTRGRMSFQCWVSTTNLPPLRSTRAISEMNPGYTFWFLLRDPHFTPKGASTATTSTQPLRSGHLVTSQRSTSTFPPVLWGPAAAPGPPNLSWSAALLTACAALIVARATPLGLRSAARENTPGQPSAASMGIVPVPHMGSSRTSPGCTPASKPIAYAALGTSVVGPNALRERRCATFVAGEIWMPTTSRPLSMDARTFMSYSLRLTAHP